MPNYQLSGDQPFGGQLPGNQPAASQPSAEHSLPPTDSPSAYIELHCHSNYSLLDGASHPEELANRARDLGYPALAITDHDGLYGAVRFAKAARVAGIRPIVGVEMTLESGDHLLLIAQNNAGYSNLCRLVSDAQLTHAKRDARLSLDTLARHSADLFCLSGCRQGEISRCLLARQYPEALEAAARYREIFGPDHFFVELQHHSLPDDNYLNALLARLASRLDLGLVATNDVHYATPDRRPLQDVLVCIRTRTSLEPGPTKSAASGAARRPNAEYYLKPPGEMARLFASYPEAIVNAGQIASQCSVDLRLGVYRFPAFDLPPGETAVSYLRRLCHAGARRLYRPVSDRVLDQISHELTIIENLGLSEYFLIVWDIVRFAREQGILAQGRGSAANSIVAYCLGITHVDPISLDLLFERFLSEERAGTPDIDIDFANSRREEVIQYVYNKYGADHTAMVCEVNTFRARGAVRDVGKALGLPLPLLDRVAKSLEHHRHTDQIAQEVLSEAEFAAAAKGYQWRQLFELCRQIDGFPRHLSIHVGGMLITARPLVEIVPLERATMPGRVVCQFDKDDVEDLGLVKIDLLGLGMLALIQDCLDLIASGASGRSARVDLDQIRPDDPRVYDMLCQGDTVGVFQVESRAQMGTLPRLKPRNFYDIVTQIAIIRPGPIQGQMVHPFIRRRQGKEPITYLHPCLEPILKKTMGIVLFQEQVIRVGMVAAGFSPGEADLLRRAMGGHRSHEKMEALRARFIAGAGANGIDEPTAGELFHQLEGFAAYGFPESHAAAFAKIVYDSAYLKLYFAPEFYCALLNNWPMGFYQPAVVVGDARRHGVPALPVDVNRSRANCTVETTSAGARVLRLGYRYVRGIGESLFARLDQTIAAGPYQSLEDFCGRTQLDRATVENLITIGAFDSFGLPRRQLLWQLPDAILAAHAGELPDLRSQTPEADLPAFTAIEEARADYQVLGLSTAYHIMDFYRARLDSRPSSAAVLRCDDLARVATGRWVRVAGVVICRQAPPTAHGNVFLTMEDETGLCSVTVRPKVVEAYHAEVRHGLALLVEGILQNQEGALSVLARRVEVLRIDEDDPARRLDPPPSRDFR